VLELLEQDLGKPAISSMQACLWHALRLAGIREPIHGFGRLLREP
jgi:maleate isomerase